MRRRTLLTTGTATGLAFLAGCASSDPEESPTGTPETDGPGDTPGGSESLSADIAPSASNISWGEEYSVTVTLVAGSEYETDWTHTEINWRTDDSNGAITNSSYSMWNIPTGEPDSHTFEITPPTTGDITFTLEDILEGSTLAEWTLTVEPPVADLGTTISYYDGLAVTIDVQLTETIEAHIYDDYKGNDLGVYSIRPADGTQWALLLLTVENTATSKLYPPSSDDMAVLVGGTQLNRADDLLFATQNEFRAVEGNPEEAYVVELSAEAGYYDPPTEIVPSATAEGWLPYLTDIDSTPADVAAVLTRNASSSVSGTVTSRWQ